ncbi:MAG: hypothetical protein COC05_06770 [Gammaproteobacteria bacterium]|nr:MAG: hypothetical protein COC05_06770 [Gammaproteobacteria bacterium]
MQTILPLLLAYFLKIKDLGILQGRLNTDRDATRKAAAVLRPLEVAPTIPTRMHLGSACARREAVHTLNQTAEEITLNA